MVLSAAGLIPILPAHAACLRCAVPPLPATIAVNNAVGKWWSPLAVKDGEPDTNARFDDLFQMMRFGSGRGACILVGHSHYFRALVRQHLAEEYKSNEPEWAADLHKCKLDNGACMCIDVEWRDTPLGLVVPVITNATMMFGTVLQKKGAKDKDGNDSDEEDGKFGSGSVPKKKGGCTVS